MRRAAIGLAIAAAWGSEIGFEAGEQVKYA
jgi:hypothetical protein